jgi:transcriptional regulator with XRE-family HTH domain
MGRHKSSVDELTETDVGRCEFVKQELALEATEKISELMEASQVTKSELARRTGSSKAYITQVLAGSRNITVHTLAALAFALGYRIELHTTPIAVANSLEVPSIELTRIPLELLAPCDNELERAQPAPICIFDETTFLYQALRQAA